MADTQTKETPAKAVDDTTAVDALVDATAATTIKPTEPATEPASEVAPVKASEATTEAKADDKAAEPTAAAVPAVTAETKPEAKAEEPTAAAAAPAPVEKKVDFKHDEKDAMSSASPLQHLWALAKAHAHPEVWGVTLADPDTHVPSQIVLQKYLNANDGDLTKAKDQLTKTLDWRAKMKPLDLLKEQFNREKFEGLGYANRYQAEGAGPEQPELTEVFTWNIYGGVKSIDTTFGDLNEFIKWRVTLMELALQDMSLSTATKPITAEYDPYKMFQVHDYKSLSFLRQSPQVKSASAETIKVFAQNYPELLKEKFFVNVPAIMGFVYAFMKLFVAPKTIKKFHPMSNGGNLYAEFGDSKVKGLGELLPKEYGGKGEDLKATAKEPALQ